MKNLLPTLQLWQQSDKPFAIATVIQTWGSSPRPTGSSMIIAEDLSMAGSVSGGCVENAVVQTAEEVISSGKAQRLSYGVSNERAWEVGLTCGGKVQVFLERAPSFDARTEEQEVWQQLVACLEKQEGCTLITCLTEDEGAHLLVKSNGQSFGTLSRDLIVEAEKAYTHRHHQILEQEGITYFIQTFPPRNRLLIIGAAHIATTLVKLAKLYDYETTVIDPRKIFMEKTYFEIPPDHLVHSYPSEILVKEALDAYTYAVILSHDPKIDDDALNVLLRSQVAYIGALGSRRTHAKRVARLQAAGFSEAEIARINAPIGVDIHAKLPEEIALSVMGELIQTKNQFL